MALKKAKFDFRVWQEARYTYQEVNTVSYFKCRQYKYIGIPATQNNHIFTYKSLQFIVMYCLFRQKSLHLIVQLFAIQILKLSKLSLNVECHPSRYKKDGLLKIPSFVV
jgi:hypothetical protein